MIFYCTEGIRYCVERACDDYKSVLAFAFYFWYRLVQRCSDRSLNNLPTSGQCLPWLASFHLHHVPKCCEGTWESTRVHPGSNQKSTGSINAICTAWNELTRTTWWYRPLTKWCFCKYEGHWLQSQNLMENIWMILVLHHRNDNDHRCGMWEELHHSLDHHGCGGLCVRTIQQKPWRHFRRFHHLREPQLNTQPMYRARVRLMKTLGLLTWSRPGIWASANPCKIESREMFQPLLWSSNNVLIAVSAFRAWCFPWNQQMQHLACLIQLCL